MQRFDVLSRELNVFAPHFLEASAGTGKTFAIEHFVTRLLIEGPSPLTIEQILVMTFTRAATRELRLRIRRNLWKTLHALQTGNSTIDYLRSIEDKAAADLAIKRIEAALVCFDAAQIFTLHGFCYRSLKECALEAGIGLEISDPDRTDPLSSLEAFAREYLCTSIQMPHYSPAQMRILLKKYRSDVEWMLSDLIKKASSTREFAVYPSFEEVYHSFLQALQTFPCVERIKWEEDLSLSTTLYKGMTSKVFSQQIAVFGQILESRECSVEQFDAMLLENHFLEKMEPGNLKVRAKPLEAGALHYPGLMERVREGLFPLLQLARDAQKIVLRIARDLQLASREVFEEREKLSPDALLFKVEEALKVPSFVAKMRKKYRAVIVDEFQDTDPVQWKIVQELFLPSVEALCLVGDPKQSIYAFRSADVYTYLNAADALGEGAKKHLDTNFRSTESVVKGLNLLFSSAEKGWMPLPALETMLPVPPVRHHHIEEGEVGGAVHFFIASGSQGRSEKFPTPQMEESKFFPFICGEIIRLEEKGLFLHEIAILVRDRFQAKRVIDHLKRGGIPAQFKRGASLAKTPAFFSLREVLSSALSPHDLSRLKAALGTPLLQWVEEDLRLGSDAFVLLEAKVKMQSLHEILRERGFAPFFQALLTTSFHRERKSVAEEVLQSGDLSLYADLRKLAEVLIEEEIARGLKGEELLGVLHQIDQESSAEDPRYRAPLHEEWGSVVVMTIHQSKGLEFNTVFALGVCARRGLSEDVIVKNVITHFDPASSDCLRAVEELDAEKMRQLYVALTRAKERLYIPYPIDEESHPIAYGESSPIELLFSKIGKGSVTEALSLMAPLITYTHIAEMASVSPKERVPALHALPPFSPFHFQKKDSRVYSFSSLAKKESVAKKPENLAVETPHALPMGSETGIILHAIFEDLFKSGAHTLTNENLLLEAIEKNLRGTSLEKWASLFFPWIKEILKKSLGTFSLSDIHPQQLQQELEFYFPLKKGVMKGFADLVFEHGGKYYLLDWKSNWLGPTDADYTEEKMAAAMQEHDYYLQARIYKEALSRYVKLFDKRPFEEVFGGAIYYFIRGTAFYLFVPDAFEEVT